MKNCDEMVNSLLERREQYVAKQNRKRKVLVHTGTSMCCVCLAALLGFSVWQGGAGNTRPEHAIGNIVCSGVEGTFDENKDNPVTNDQINIQKVEELPSNTLQMLFALKGDDFISMSRDEINEYYGINIFPTVPSDLKEDDGETLGIYKRENGKGNIYWDTNGMDYFNEDNSRCVYVCVDKDCVPFDFCNLFDDVQTRSMINNIEVGIAQNVYGEFYAEFMYHNVGFRIVSEGLTQDELVEIVSSIIK